MSDETGNLAVPDAQSTEIDVLAALHAVADDMPAGDYRAGWSDALDEVAQTAENDRVDVYPVGVLHTLQVAWRALTKRHPDLRGKRLAIARREVRKEWLYIWDYCVKGRRWRALRNTFNGYLAEHYHGGHNCGRGWTKRAAIRRADRLCTSVIPPGNGA